ncbi:hypothetical protein Tco_1373683, partial [Tanacetum coccineum]
MDSKQEGSNSFVSEQGGSSSNVMHMPLIKFVNNTSCPSVTKVNNIENARKPTKYAEMYRNTSQSSNAMSRNDDAPIIEDWESETESEIDYTVRPSTKQTSKGPSIRGNQRNWNNLKSQQLGKDFVMQNKACFKCGCFDHLAANCRIWEEKEVTWPRNNYKNMTPRAVLLKSGLKPTAPIRPVSTDKPNVLVLERPFVRKSAAKKVWVPKVPTVSTKVPTFCKKVPTVGFKVPTTKPTVAANLGNKGKAIKALARWIWKPKQNDSNQGSNANGVSGKPQDNIDDKGFWDSGCSRHMTGNISYLSDFEP